MRKLLTMLSTNLLALMLMASAVASQSVLERSPNLSGGWVGSSGTLYFNFLHRFDQSGPPERKVSNAPTFLVAMGLPAHTLAGFNYATSSDVGPRIPNEWEFFVRNLPLSQSAGAPFDVSVQAGYNLAATSLDGELALGRWIGPVRLMAAARGMSNGYYAGETRFAWAGGAGVRLMRFLVVAGDVASLVDRRAGEEMAWSAGAQLAIPYTPHTLSLHASNVNTGTLQGSSRGAGGVRYGFEFTIPVTLSRYLGRGSQPAVEAAAPAPVPAVDSLAAAAAADSVVADSVVVVQRPDTAAAAPMVAQAPSAPSDTTAAKPEAKTPEAPVKKPAPAPRRTARRASTVAVAIEGFKFVPARLEVAVGTTVVWTNRDQVVHTATADNRSWDSGLIQPGATWRRTFDRPGTYPYHCTPHPFMKGVIVVR